MKILKTINRKLSHQAYGGYQYETTDLFISLEKEIDDEGKDNVQKTIQELSGLAKAEIDKEVLENKREISKERSEDKKIIHPF